MATQIVGIVGIFLLYCQLRQTAKWNRVNTQHALLNDLPTEDQEKRLTTIYRASKDATGVIPRSAAQAIFDDVEKNSCTKSVLNKYEHLCAAINGRVTDENYAYSVHSARVMRSFDWFVEYIAIQRDLTKDNEIFVELEKVVCRWKRRYDIEEERKKKARLKEAGLRKV